MIGLQIKGLLLGARPVKARQAPSERGSGLQAAAEPVTRGAVHRRGAETVKACEHSSELHRAAQHRAARHAYSAPRIRVSFVLDVNRQLRVFEVNTR